LIFDGVDDALYSPFNQLPVQSGTLAHWLWADDARTQVAFYSSDSSGPLDYNGFGSAGTALEIHSGSDGSWVFHLQDGNGPTGSNGSYRVTGPPVVPGRWTHVAATWDRAGDLVLYVDCVEVDRVSLVGATFLDLSQTSTRLGRPVEATRYWAGRVDDVRLFDEPLSAGQLKAAFCGRRQPHRQELLDPSMLADGIYKVAADGDTILVGNDGGGGLWQGRAWMVERDAAGVWGTPAVLDLTPAAGDALGNAVDVEGDTMAIGAPQRVPPAGGVGYVVVMQRVAGTWTTSQVLQAPGLPVADFGTSVSLSGDRLAVGGPDHDGNRGRVWVYRRVSGTWTLEQTIDQEVPAPDNYFGWYVALRGPDLMVAAPGDGLRGSVHFYRLGTAWDLVSTLLIPDSMSTYSMSSVALGEGFAVAGVPLHDFPYPSNGQVLVFQRDETKGLWYIGPALQAPDADPYDNFGTNVAIEGERVLVHAFPFNVPGLTAFDVGNAYLWRWDGNLMNLDRHLVVQDPPQFEFPIWGAALLPDGAVFGADFVGNTVGLYTFDLPFFADGFESGDFSAWSAAAP
jgi:hypothetical protein